MPLHTNYITGVIAALAIGFLIGLERERRKSDGSGLAPGGVRTFILASLVGVISVLTGEIPLLAVSVFVTGGLTAISYLRTQDKDPGLTTEIALVLTVILGGLSAREPLLAVGVAVIVTVLLVSRNRLHQFANETLTAVEIRDGLLLATAALVIWPLLPDRPIDPFGAINIKSIWLLIVLIMSVSAIGYVGTRIIGPKMGLPFVGLASGFVSSIATLAAMGQRAIEQPSVLNAAVAGATLSSVATLVQLAIILFAVSPETLVAAAPSLIAGGLTALVYSLFFVRRAFAESSPEIVTTGRPFDPKAAIELGLVISFVLIVTAVINRYLGSSAMLLGTAIAGFADAHAPSVAVASLVKDGKISLDAALLSVLAVITTNTISKIVVTIKSGSKAFRWRVIPGLGLIIVSLWAVLLVPFNITLPNY